MFYTYVLKSLKNGRNYIGSTEDLKQRVQEHNSGKGGHYTSINRPFELVYYEAYIFKKDALSAEKFYKSGYGREVLKDKLKNYLQIAGSSSGKAPDSGSGNEGSAPKAHSPLAESPGGVK